MSSAEIDDLIGCQNELIRALDMREIPAIFAAANALSAVAERARFGVERHQEAQKVEYALKQSTALKIRINTLSAWNRQRIDRLGELRGVTPRATYRKYNNT
jgi:hypothetical protein